LLESYYYYYYYNKNHFTAVAVYHAEFSLHVVTYLEKFRSNFKEISAGMKFEVVLLVMSANGIVFGKEENLVEIVESAKQFFRSGCVYLLQYQEAGKYNIVICFACGTRLSA